MLLTPKFSQNIIPVNHVPCIPVSENNCGKSQYLPKIKYNTGPITGISPTAENKLAAYEIINTASIPENPLYTKNPTALKNIFKLPILNKLLKNDFAMFSILVVLAHLAAIVSLIQSRLKFLRHFSVHATRHSKTQNLCYQRIVL